MRIETNRHTNETGNRNSLYKRVATVLIILLIPASSFIAGVASQKRIHEAWLDCFSMLGGVMQQGRPRSEKIHAILTVAPRNYLQAVRKNEKVDKIYIDIKFKHVQKLNKKRDEALKKGVLVSESDDFVPAKIRHGGHIYHARLRLKGDLVDHLKGDKWSFRIHMKDNETLFGMRHFSIQAPYTRSYHWEALIMEHFRMEDLLAPRYFFIDVNINGKDIGLMAVEEHFAKELLESQRRRESVFLRFDESLWWEDRKYNRPPDNTSNCIYFNHATTFIDSFESSRVEKSPKLTRDYNAAVGLLRGFIHGELAPSMVFDAKITGRFLAMAEVWDTYHILLWRNIRFYYNPITAHIEPIIYDSTMNGLDIPTRYLNVRNNLSERMLRDPVIKEVFDLELKRLTDEMISGKIHSRLAALEQRDMNILHREYPLVREFDFERIKQRAKTLVARARDIEKPFPYPGERFFRLINAYITETPLSSFLELMNNMPYPVVVTDIHWRNIDSNAVMKFEPTGPLELPLRLEPTPVLGVPDLKRIPFSRDNGDDRNWRLEVESRLEGKKDIYTVKAREYIAVLNSIPIERTTTRNVLSRHEFLEYDEDKQVFKVKPGEWHVNGMLITPIGAGLKIPPGVTLRFDVDGGIIVRGPVWFSGTRDAKIVLENDEGTSTGWFGIAVLRSETPSQMQYVLVRNTTGINRNGWQTTGGVTFFENDIHISDCGFSGNRAEDTINIVRSNFLMERVSFSNTASDAFDGDFVDGVVRDGTYDTIGGDGIDLSGSRILVDNVHFSNITDKGISAGENSFVTAKKLVLNKVSIGLASKDLSLVNISDSEISGSTVAGLAAYQKKSEYGPASIQATSIRFSDTRDISLVQTGSSINLDGKDIPSAEVDMNKLYEQGP